MAMSPHTTSHIARSITEAIATRRLQPGTKLTEQTLCQQYGVSRTLVRQALNQLSRDHLVTLIRGRGAFVAQPTAVEAQQVFEVRAMLETMIVCELCSRITPAQIEQLKAHLKAEEQALGSTDVTERTRLLGEFHLILANLQGNGVLRDILSDLLLRSSLSALTGQSTESASQSHAEHVLLVQALEQGDSLTATGLIQAHLQHVERNLANGHANDHPI
jgi:DNA-binding GntR family transcriptional regulator